MFKNFSIPELQMLNRFLEELQDVQSNAGCNDLILQATPENVAFMNEFNPAVEEHDRLDYYQGKIAGMDISVTYYFRQRIQDMIEHLQQAK